MTTVIFLAHFCSPLKFNVNDCSCTYVCNVDIEMYLDTSLSWHAHAQKSTEKRSLRATKSLKIPDSIAKHVSFVSLNRLVTNTSVEVVVRTYSSYVRNWTYATHIHKDLQPVLFCVLSTWRARVGVNPS